MAIQQDVRNTQRLVLVKFERAVTGNPVDDAPDPDERGYGPPERGPIIGIGQRKSIRVKLRRGVIDPAAPLFVTSSDTTILTIANPATGTVPIAPVTDITLTGVDGGADFRRARLEVRFQSVSGPIIGILHVRVFRLIDVDITPHVVTIGRSGGPAGAAPIANIPGIMALVRAIWIHYGITFTVGAVRNKTIQLATANIVSDSPFPNELRIMLATNWPDGTPNSIPNTINAYFVNQIGTGGTLGYGFSRASFAARGFQNPGILLADRTAGGPRADLMHWGNDLAHEVGHFFQLWHPENLQPPNEREDTWSRRMLMHNFNLMRGRNPHPTTPASAFRPRFNDAGYGPNRRGCSVTIKDLTQLVTDGESGTARGVINSAAGPY